MVTIDGRRIAVPSAHFALGIYLQSNEAIIMKKSLVLVRERARHLDWQLRMVVHDEMQSSCLIPQAEELGDIQVRAIVDSGNYYGLKCPLNGTTTIGSNWAETH
jgi:DNA polymerase I-like protein with 3'-5' exonuclease and polymerase domains